MTQPLASPIPSGSDPAAARASLAEVAAIRERLVTALDPVIVGQHDVIEDLLASLLCGGHCLLEGVPGLAKTLLVRSLAAAIDLGFGRIQFTPDLMPADIIGTDVLETEGHDSAEGIGRRHLRFLPGPLFNNVILADEINRAPPKTQSALLEAMQETQVTVGSVRHRLPRPFFVLATRNPIEQEGTYPMPEGQLDRFMMMLTIDYPGREDELEIIRRTTGADEPAVQPVIDRDALARASTLVRAMPVAGHVMEAAIDLVRATRPGTSEAPPWVGHWVRYGAGPRASQFIVLSAKAHAALAGRPCVELGDIHRAAPAVLRHRLVRTFSAETDGISSETIIRRLLADTPRRG
ncbi:MAG: AAA family ATPase [Planctomycetia bacterium]